MQKLIGKKPFITLLRTANFTPRIEQYAEYTRLSYEKMQLPKIDSTLKEMTKQIETDSQAYTTIKSLEDNKFYENLSQKLKQISDLIDNKYLDRSFKEDETNVSTQNVAQTNQENDNSPKVESVEEPKQES